MSRFEALPRDVQLEIIKRFDIDARIRTGIIGKIKIPKAVEETLSNRPVISKNAFGSSYVFLGTPIRYHISYDDLKRRWEVFHMTLTGCMSYHEYDSSSNLWKERR